MTPSVEQELRELFATDAAHAPGATGLATGALRKVRRRRTVRLAQVTLAVALLAAATTAGVAAAPGPTALPIPSTAPPSTRMTDMEQTTSCVVGYSPAEVSRRAFAFDGTVLSFTPGEHGYDVTMRVNRWFRGDGRDQITVAMPSPGVPSNWGDAHIRPVEYAVGTRLLVSGEAKRDPRGKGRSPLEGKVRIPLEEPAAWWGCGGFTREYTPEDADRWAAATR